MNKHGIRLLVAVIAASTVGLTGAPKDAEAVSLNLINNWKMGDWATLGNGPGGPNGSGPAWSKGAFYQPGIQVHFGVGFGKGDQIVPYLGLAVQRRSYSFTYDPDPDERDAGLDEFDDTGAALQFGLEIGGKFFFIERSKGKAPPFIDVSFYKYFGSITEDSDYDSLPGNIGDPDAVDNGGDATGQAIGDHVVWDQQTLSPTGFRLAFGAEYYFNDNFSLGGQFLGIDFSFVRARVPTNVELIDFRTQFNLYTMLTMTYRFSFSVRASVQFESEYDYED